MKEFQLNQSLPSIQCDCNAIPGPSLGPLPPGLRGASIKNFNKTGRIAGSR